MKNRLTFLAAAVVAGLLMFCGQAAMHGGPDGGVLGDAGAAACCGTASGFTKILDGTLRGGLPTSAATSAAGYGELVVYTRNRAQIGTLCQMHIEWRPDADTPFGTTTLVDLLNGGRVTVDGADFQLISGTGCNGAYSLDYTVAGTK